MRTSICLFISVIFLSTACVSEPNDGFDNEEVGEIEVYEFRQIVREVTNRAMQVSWEQAVNYDPGLTEDAIGEDLGIKLDTRQFGRIAAQNAKQIIFQRVREAERNTIYEEYKDRQGELVTGTVRRFERGNVIVDLGRAEGAIGHREQVKRENIRAGDRVVAYVVDVQEISRGPQIVLSRTHPNPINDGVCRSLNDCKSVCVTTSSFLCPRPTNEVRKLTTPP